MPWKNSAMCRELRWSRSVLSLQEVAMCGARRGIANVSVSAPLGWAAAGARSAPVAAPASVERGARSGRTRRAGRTHGTVLSKPRVSALPPAARPPHTVAGTCLRNVTYLHTFPDNVRLASSYRQIARPVHGAVYFTGSNNSSYIFCSEV